MFHLLNSNEISVKMKHYIFKICNGDDSIVKFELNLKYCAGSG